MASPDPAAVDDCDQRIRGLSQLGQYDPGQKTVNPFLYSGYNADSEWALLFLRAIQAVIATSLAKGTVWI
jgi:hypothetical protein